MKKKKLTWSLMIYGISGQKGRKTSVFHFQVTRRMLMVLPAACGLLGQGSDAGVCKGQAASVDQRRKLDKRESLKGD